MTFNNVLDEEALFVREAFKHEKGFRDRLDQWEFVDEWDFEVMASHISLGCCVERYNPTAWSHVQSNMFVLNEG